MQRFPPLAGLSLAALLAVAGCSSPSPSPSSSPSPSPSAEADGTTTAHDGSRTYSSEELAAILGTVTEADGAALQVLPTDQIDQGMDQARRFLESVVITPEECAVFASNTLEVPEDAGYATGVSGAGGDAVQTIVSASSSADAAFFPGRIDASSAALQACSSFTVEAQGVVIDQTVQDVDAATDADRSFGNLTLQSSPDGARQETMTVIGTRGSLAVTAVRTARDALPQGTQDELQDLIDETLAAAG
ncbi:hypothetical protein ACX80L_03680 [Arthrobacter sp. MDT1-48-3]